MFSPPWAAQLLRAQAYGRFWGGQTAGLMAARPRGAKEKPWEHIAKYPCRVMPPRKAKPTGSLGWALAYPIALPAVSFLLAFFFMPETRKHSIWEEGAIEAQRSRA